MSENTGRFPLAFDLNGNPLEIPAGAVAWRVRRGGGRKGRPRNVFDADTGRQLEIPLGATLEDLIQTGCAADRYLLYPVDAEGRIIPGIVAVTEIAEGVGCDDDEPDGVSGDLIGQLLQTVRAQSDTLCRALVAATSGYGPVRQTGPAPLLVEQPSDGGIKPDQIAQIANAAKAVFESFKPQTPGGST
jgi:hypothetical protein